MIVGGDAAAYGRFGVPVEADRSPGRGPLGGIHAALRASRFPHVFCIACDMPLADPAVIRHLCSLAQDHDVVVPWTAHGLEPLHAVYARDCIPHLERMLQSGRLRVDALYAAVRVRRVGEEELRMLDPTLRGFLNVNTPEELEAARRLLAGESEAPRGS
jgi:molybdopterin-guanine dinucleotide biosynthesis protein A